MKSYADKLTEEESIEEGFSIGKIKAKILEWNFCQIEKAPAVVQNLPTPASNMI